MTTAVKHSDAPREFATHFHLLGRVDYEDCLSAQRRLAYDAMTRGDGRVVVLLCEHPPLITIGRGGSRRDLQFAPQDLLQRQLEVRYVCRGGGTLLHGPGQLAIYPIVPLAWHSLTVGAYLRRLQAGLRAALLDVGFRCGSLPGHFGLWGRRGLLAAVGVAVKNGITTQGAFVNVSPEMRDMRRIAVGSDWGRGTGDQERGTEDAVQEAGDRRQEALRAVQNPKSKVEYPSSESSNLKSQISDLKSEIPNLKSEIPNLKSDVQNPPTFSSLLSEHGRAVKMTSVRAAIVQRLAEAFGSDNYHLHTGHPFLAEMTPTASLGKSHRETAA